MDAVHVEGEELNFSYHVNIGELNFADVLLVCHSHYEVLTKYVYDSENAVNDF